jgi:hypothetical protein
VINLKQLPIVNTELVALIDDEDYEIASKYKWYACRSSKKGITSVMTKLPTVNGNRPTVYLHRLIMNAPDGKFVDHINRDVLDNRKENLRLCNNQQNCCNRMRTNSSGYKGVFKRREKKYTRDRYRAYINLDGKRVNLGTFDTAEEAALAYNKKAIELHGKFASLNIL